MRHERETKTPPTGGDLPVISPEPYGVSGQKRVRKFFRLQDSVSFAVALEVPREKIAEVLSISHSTVRVLINRSRQEGVLPPPSSERSDRVLARQQIVSSLRTEERLGDQQIADRTGQPLTIVSNTLELLRRTNHDQKSLWLKSPKRPKEQLEEFNKRIEGYLTDQGKNWKRPEIVKDIAKKDGLELDEAAFKRLMHAVDTAISKIYERDSSLRKSRKKTSTTRIWKILEEDTGGNLSNSQIIEMLRREGVEVTVKQVNNTKQGYRRKKASK